MTAKPERDTPGIILAAVFIVTGGIFLAESRNLMDADSYVFPSAICAVMILLSTIFIIKNLVRPQPDVDASIVPGSTFRRAGLVAMMLASALVMPYVGFVLGGLGVFAALTVLAMFEPWNPKRALLYALVGAAIVSVFYIVFAKVFLVPLPEMPFL